MDSRPMVMNFFMLNSAELEILNVHRYKNYNIKKFCLFQAHIGLECYFFLLINVKMPTIQLLAF